MMADVFTPQSFTMHALEHLEGACSTHKKFITNFLVIFVMLIFWIIIAELIVVDHARFEFVEDMPTGPLADVTTQVSKRTLHRVFEIMKQRCKLELDDVIFASQVLVSGKPFMHRAFYLCLSKMSFINPVVVSHGVDQAVCVDSYKEVTKRATRFYPITVHSLNNEPHTLFEIDDVCMVMAAIDILNNT